MSTVPDAALVRSDGLYWLYNLQMQRWEGYAHFDGDDMWLEAERVGAGSGRGITLNMHWLTSRTHEVVDLNAVAVWKGEKAPGA